MKMWFLPSLAGAFVVIGIGPRLLAQEWIPRTSQPRAVSTDDRDPDLRSVSRKLAHEVDQLQKLLDVASMERDLGARRLEADQKQALRSLLQRFRRQWVRDGGFAGSEDKHAWDAGGEKWFESLLQGVQSQLPEQHGAIAKYLMSKRLLAEAKAEAIEQAAQHLGGAAEHMAQGVTQWAELFSSDMESWGEELEQDWAPQWESWAEQNADQWELWGENYGQQWEDWARQWEQGADGWAIPQETVTLDWTRWAEQFADSYSGDLEAWADDYEEQWETWGKDYASQWEEWGKNLEDQVQSGEGFSLDGFFQNLKKLEDMPLQFEAIPLPTPPPMDAQTLQALIQMSVEGSLQGLLDLKAIPVLDEASLQSMESYARGITTASEEYRAALEKLQLMRSQKFDEKWRTFHDAFGGAAPGRVLDVHELRERLLEKAQAHRDKKPQEVAEEILESDRSHEEVVETLVNEITDERATIEARDRELEALRAEVEALRREVEKIRAASKGGESKQASPTSDGDS